MPVTPEILAAEFDMFMRRAGLTVSAERRDQLLPGYAELRDQVELLRGPRNAAAEPSNTFRLHPVKAV